MKNSKNEKITYICINCHASYEEHVTVCNNCNSDDIVDESSILEN